MSQLTRIYRMRRMLTDGSAIRQTRFVEEFDVSKSTFKRDLSLLRDQIAVPIVWDRKLRGYRIENHGAATDRVELPGMWFAEEELLALVSAAHLLEQIEPRLLNETLNPLRTKLETLIASGKRGAGKSADGTTDIAQFLTRIKVLPMNRRSVDDKHFAAITAALFKRRRLRVHSVNRQTKRCTLRDLSPQRLVSYRDNWYLDAWCHLRKALRTFSLDTLQTVRVLDDAAEDISAADLDQHFASSYGIFAGKAVHSAVLRFRPSAAGWVEREQWHPEQTSKALADGSIELTVPYGNATELIRDILRWGADVEVVAPEALREEVKAQVLAMVKIYL